MDGETLVAHQSESGTSETTDTSGELTDKWELDRRDWDGNYLKMSGVVPAPDSIKEIVCTGVLEYIHGNERGEFMDHCYRILIDTGKMTITVPYWNSWRAYYDARFEWPPFCEQSFLCYNKSWREANTKGLDLECDFDFTYGYAWETETLARNDESRAFWTKHYTNSVDALQLTLTKRPKDGTPS